MTPKTAQILAALLSTGAAIGAEVPRIIRQVERLTDDTKTNDAKAALRLHRIAGRIAESVLDHVPGAPTGAIDKMHDGLHLLLMGVVEAATGEDPSGERTPDKPPAEMERTGPTWLDLL